MKIGIVGADGNNPAWTPEREEKAKLEIRRVFWSHATSERPRPEYNRLILVSGHCPVGEERPFCVNCGKWIDDGFERESHFARGHKFAYVYDKGGIDTFAEIIATELGVVKEIYPAERTDDGKFHWEDTWDVCGCGDPKCDRVIKGYRSRNIDMANTIPLPPNGVLYDIEPKGSCKHCGGKGVIVIFPNTVKNCKFCKGTCNYSGGTWTMRYAEKLGKEVHQVVIE